MRDAWWVERELERLREEQVPARPAIELPLYQDEDPAQAPSAEEPAADRGVVVIDF